MTHGSLFAGIGGFDLGFERAGIKTVWQVEIDPFCRKVLEKHWPYVQRFEDIRECRGLPAVDIITGGFPCQDISAAGNRVGITGERSGLWKEMLRIICELRPRFVVVENVAALLWRGIGTVLSDLSFNGYDAEWRVIRAHQFGLNHRRMRVFIVAYPASVRFKTFAVLRRDVPTCQAETSGAQQPPWMLSRRAFGRNWAFPDTGTFRVPDGLPDWMERMHGCGNAVVPSIAEWIAREIQASVA